ncbi:MAG: hypothetical protein ABIJ96_04685 [Elusimicrobiota bacterium]
MRAYLLETPPQDVFDHMALDEAVLDRAPKEREDCWLRVYSWSGPPPWAVTFGCSQTYESVAEAVRRRYGGVTLPLVRRSTGGGIVYHEDDLTFSFVFPWRRMTAPAEIYRGIHLGLHAGLKARGLRSRLWNVPSARAPQECFTAPEATDLVHEDGTKFVGGALRRRRERGLYQGSMRTERFADRSRLVEALLEGFSLQWRVVFDSTGPDAAVAAAAKLLRAEKYAKDVWNQRR